MADKIAVRVAAIKLEALLQAHRTVKQVAEVHGCTLRQAALAVDQAILVDYLTDLKNRPNVIQRHCI
jgi:hypothetical protein